MSALHCRTCGSNIDHTMNPHDPRWAPRDKSVSICLTCAEVSVFVVGPLGVSLREPTNEELGAFAGEADFRSAMRAVQMAIALRKSGWDQPPGWPPPTRPN